MRKRCSNNPSSRQRASIALLLVALGGCVPVSYTVATVTDPGLIETEPRTADHFARLQDLTDQLVALGPDVDRIEATALAKVALVYPMLLAEKYKLTQPAITHNMLVNVGLKPRGLCIHWTEDMLSRLQKMDLQSLDLYWGVAYPTKPFRLQHSTPVITAKGQPFESGILLDGWRDSGRLFYARVPDDERYAWQLHFKANTPSKPVVSRPLAPSAGGLGWGEKLRRR